MASLLQNRASLNGARACIRCQLGCSPPVRLSRAPGRHARDFSAQPALRSQDAPPRRKKFTYHAAASFSAKYGQFHPSANVFHFNPYNRVQTEKKRAKSKRPPSGQDAFFISRVGDTNALAFGVADGVGGWEESGVDPADFSHSFCDYMASAAYEHRPDARAPPLTARSLMQRGYDDVCKDKSIPAGGSTAVVAIASEDGNLEVANLGDSGFVQLRLRAVHTYSEPQTHAFNTPYQLSIVPASMLARAAAFGGAQLCDYPKDADVTQHNLQHGDILVFASDGVWDNLFNQDILGIASYLMDSSGAWRATEDGIRAADDLRRLTDASAAAPIDRNAPQSKAGGSSPPQGGPSTLQAVLASAIAQAARSASKNQRLDGPFAKEVHKHYPGETWHGGKVDDICVVVVIASEDGRASAPVQAKL
ncbi:protein serine/threonine phosphatase 2C [Xylariaceae sp. FL0804]|nr:protein serine/threonine phosphatase 2C [Xylariaceae sp. FL0804]